MLSKQENFLTMAHAVNEVLKKYSTKWANVPRFVQGATELNDLVDLTTIGNAKADSDNTGATVDKFTAGRIAMKQGISLGKRASIYALDKGNMDLHRRLRFNRSELEHGHDTEALAKMREVYDLLNGIVAELAPYAVLPADVQHYKKLVDEYDHMLTKPRQLITARKTLNTQVLPANLKNIQETLEVLDAFMHLFEKTPFYGDYFNARKIVELGSRPRGDQEEEKPKPEDNHTPPDDLEIEGDTPPDDPEKK